MTLEGRLRRIESSGGAMATNTHRYCRLAADDAEEEAARNEVRALGGDPDTDLFLIRLVPLGRCERAIV